MLSALSTLRVYSVIVFKFTNAHVNIPHLNIYIDQTCIQPFDKTKGAIRPTTIGVTDVSSPNKYWSSTQHIGISDDLSKRKQGQKNNHGNNFSIIRFSLKKLSLID